MDAGLAAVCGALAGAVATTGAALATGWATREAARIAARSQHRKDRREPRQAIYKDFLTAAHNFARILKRSGGMVSNIEQIDEAFSNELQAVAAEITRIRVDLSLHGPENVSELARKIDELAVEARTETSVYVVLGVFEDAGELTDQDRRDRQNARERIRYLTPVIQEQTIQFERAARLALDDDGSQ
ncbi:hypothetical protein RM717_00015 [Streptomyces griseus]|uniref:Proline dehydrogenase n=1 Tax=Streptomyces stephensoniae TaxID=3375367 RepID=A0ABU2VTF9_9ACTN|nr:hypothetical protein [Streptomyces griseus]MDT0488886.1 hypothetical protein [Streptomyces griseus]